MIPSNIEYRNSPVLEQFTQSSDGFGLSNFRNDSHIPSTINRATTDFQLKIKVNSLTQSPNMNNNVMPIFYSLIITEIFA